MRADIRLTAGARTLVRTLKRLGFTVALVSGGFIEVVGPLAAELGIDHAHANRLDIRDGCLTGGLVGQIVDRQGKAQALRRFAAAEHLPMSRTVAIGDGANDLDMLAAAGLALSAGDHARGDRGGRRSRRHTDASAGPARSLTPLRRPAEAAPSQEAHDARRSRLLMALRRFLNVQVPTTPGDGLDRANFRSGTAGLGPRPPSLEQDSGTSPSRGSRRRRE